ncbi:MAG: invasion associated locus B family protein [Rhodomicrobium sp.]
MRLRLLLSGLIITLLPQAVFAQQFQTQQVPPQAAPTPATAPKSVKPHPAPKKATAAPAAATTVKARLLEKIKDWSVFVYEDANGRVCFAAAPPSDMQPKTAKRTPVIFYVSTWQKDGVRNEVSVRLGYSMKAKSPAMVTAGGKQFALTAEDDKAYPKDPAEERKLLAAMAAGGVMIVKATSARGTTTTDQYSLDGAPAAVQKLQQACP